MNEPRLRLEGHGLKFKSGMSLGSASEVSESLLPRPKFPKSQTACLRLDPAQKSKTGILKLGIVPWAAVVAQQWSSHLVTERSLV